MNSRFTMCKDVVVEKNHYYTKDELKNIKQYVISGSLQQKLKNINLKIKKMNSFLL